MDKLIIQFLKSYDVPISKAEIIRRYNHLTPRQTIASMRRLKGAKLNPRAQVMADMTKAILGSLPIKLFKEIRDIPKSSGKMITIRQPLRYKI